MIRCAEQLEISGSCARYPPQLRCRLRFEELLAILAEARRHSETRLADDVHGLQPRVAVLRAAPAFGKLHRSKIPLKAKTATGCFHSVWNRSSWRSRNISFWNPAEKPSPGSPSFGKTPICGSFSATCSCLSGNDLKPGTRYGQILALSMSSHAKHSSSWLLMT